MLKERTDDLGIPRVLNLPIGHVAGNAALPMDGWLASMETRANSAWSPESQHGFHNCEIEWRRHFDVEGPASSTRTGQPSRS